MPDFIIDILERHRNVPGREELLNEYVRRFAGKRMGEFAMAAPVPQLDQSHVQETIQEPEPQETAIPALSEACEAATEPEQQPTITMERIDEGQRSETVAFEAVTEQVIEGAQDKTEPETEEERTQTVAFEAISPAPTSRAIKDNNRKKKRKRR